ncbi:hypothetical protein V5O48_016082 [Marasmius crinis-equi]|uniref:Uncharacterized protein n=1 Tax=Marasmius crinis-equi TaxID=585013 RepID=A0ABR3ET22_9AGAR
MSTSDGPEEHPPPPYSEPGPPSPASSPKAFIRPAKPTSASRPLPLLPAPLKKKNLPRTDSPDGQELGVNSASRGFHVVNRCSSTIPSQSPTTLALLTPSAQPIQSIPLSINSDGDVRSYGTPPFLQWVRRKKNSIDNDIPPVPSIPVNLGSLDANQSSSSVSLSTKYEAKRKKDQARERCEKLAQELKERREAEMARVSARKPAVNRPRKRDDISLFAVPDGGFSM